MQHQRLRHRVGLIVAAVAACAIAAVLLVDAARGPLGRVSGRRVSFGGEIQPIFDSKCTSCHPISYPYLDLRAGRSYRELVGVPSPLAPAFERVLPGRPELSYLLTHVPDPSRRHLLSDAERALIARWIREGATGR